MGRTVQYMNWMNKLEKKIGRYAIPNISLYLIIAYVVGQVLYYTPLSGILNWFSFAPQLIFRGQVWRLVTWIFIPIPTNMFLALIFMFCLFSMSRSLEMFIGTFKMNVYIIGGIILNDVLGLVVYGITKACGFGISPYLTPYYILLSIFMALAICIPDAQVNIWFVLPIKMKWMLIFYFLDLGYEIYCYFRVSWLTGVVVGSQIIFALINLGLFFLFSKPRRSIKQMKRQREFHAQFKEPRPGSGITTHKCAVCGRTEKDDPGLVFRYCSKCAGAKEYCQEHLFTHTHVTGDFVHKD